MGGRFDGRVALVTGAAGAGIGRATARRLALDGAAVVVTDSHERRTAETAEALDAEAPAAVIGLPLDVGDRERIDEVVAEATARLGPIDVLVNNAAVNVLTEMADMDPADWDRTLAVDLSGPWYLTRAVLPGMKKLGRGAVVNVTSVAGWLGGGREGPYAAAKAALHSLTRTVALEAGPHGIRCNSVAPGIIWSRFVEKYAERFEPEIARTPLGRLGQPDDIADVIAFLAGDGARWMTGQTLVVDGGAQIRHNLGA
jgi:NAD(P)-dependent dehydrogenase (short-subunit alcohol dehydrogenase family)